MFTFTTASLTTNIMTTTTFTLFTDVMAKYYVLIGYRVFWVQLWQTLSCRAGPYHYFDAFSFCTPAFTEKEWAVLDLLRRSGHNHNYMFNTPVFNHLTGAHQQLMHMSMQYDNFINTVELITWLLNTLMVCQSITTAATVHRFVLGITTNTLALSSTSFCG